MNSKWTKDRIMVGFKIKLIIFVLNKIFKYKKKKKNTNV